MRVHTTDRLCTRVVRFKVQILISVVRLPVYCQFSRTIVYDVCAQVQEGQFAVRFRFDCKFDVVVNAVDVPGEPFHVILMDLNIRIINVTQP